jgi:hypothetical protein
MRSCEILDIATALPAPATSQYAEILAIHSHLPFMLISRFRIAAMDPRKAGAIGAN